MVNYTFEDGTENLFKREDWITRTGEEDFAIDMFSKLTLPVKLTVSGTDNGFETFVEDFNGKRIIVNGVFTFGYSGHGSIALTKAIKMIPNFNGDLSFIKKNKDSTDVTLKIEIK